MHKLITLLISLAVLTLTFGGCYTILMHPKSEEGYTEQDYKDACLDCHPDYHEYPYGYFYGTYPDYWWSSPRYGQYYAYPWWWDYYWDPVDGHAEHGDEFVPRTSDGKKAVRRDALRPPYSSPGTTIITRGNSTTSTGSSGGTTSSGNTKKTSDDKKKEEKSDEKVKKTRRSGGRR